MSDLDQHLREAAARLRDPAPTPAAIEAALRTLDDVQLDGHPAGGSRRWIIGPAVLLAAAAAIVGVIVMTRSDQSAVVPSDTVSTTATSTTVAESGLLDGVILETSNEDFDGDGGACLTLSTPTDRAGGCAEGPLMRTAFGQPLWLRLGDTPYWLYPTGTNGSGEAELLPAENTPPPCSTSMVQPGVLVEVAGCDSTYPGIIGVLPPTPDDDVAWLLVSPDLGAAGTDIALVTASPDMGARVFRSQWCTIVTARNNSVRESCGGPETFLAGSADAPLVVARAATIDRLDAATELAINGCDELTAGELVALLPEHGVADFLLCRGDVGTVRVAPTMTGPRFAETAWDILQRGTDGSWTVAASEVDYTCRDGVAAEACAALGILDLAGSPPFPSAASVTAFDQAMAGVDTLPWRLADDEVLPLVTPAADLPALSDAVAAAMIEAQGGDGVAEVIAGASSPIVIRRTNLDDSVTATVFVLNAGAIDTGEVVVFSRGNLAVDVCGRGTTTVDGVTVCL